MILEKLFTRVFRRGGKEAAAQPLAIEGVTPAPVTAEPDDAELAAQAVLELMAHGKRKAKNEESPDPVSFSSEDEKGSAFYRHVADRIREARTEAALRATRFVAFAEQQLRNPRLPLTGKGSLALLEAELYKRIDIIEREGGKLKRRWQHCLAVVTVRMMDDAQDGRGEDG